MDPQLSASSGLSGHHARSYTALVSRQFAVRLDQWVARTKGVFVATVTFTMFGRIGTNRATVFYGIAVTTPPITQTVFA